MSEAILQYPWHQAQWLQIQQQKKANRLAHAILLQGPDGLAKHQFARQLVAGLLCLNNTAEGLACGSCAACHLYAVQTHPDLFVVKAEEPGKAIKVDTIRQLSADLQLTSQMSGYKVAIIENADSMNINAANSLLKTLEEPTRDSLLILVSSNPTKLPITVRSRCQSLSFSIPDSGVATNWLKQQDVQQAEYLLTLAHGAPLRALDFQTAGLLEHNKQLIECLMLVANNHPVVELAERMHKLPQLVLLNCLYDWVQDLIKLHQCGDTAPLIHYNNKPDLLKLQSRTTLHNLYDYLDQLNKCKQLQSIPLNTQLLWEDLLLSWHKQLKQV